MSLTKQLSTPSSPMRVFFEERPDLFWFDQARRVTATQERAPHLLPPGSSRELASALGTAIGARVAWELAPLDGAIIAGAHDVFTSSLQFATLPQFLEAWAGPPPRDKAKAARLAWFAGLCEQTVRSHRCDSDWYAPLIEGLDFDTVLNAAPEQCVADILAVMARTQPVLPDPAGTVHIGPAFAGSQLVGEADADLIVDGCVLDVKAGKDPGWRATVGRQLVGYALLDFEDVYEIQSVGLLYARFGTRVVWDVDEVFTGGRPAMIEARSELRAHLEMVRAAAQAERRTRRHVKPGSR